MLHCLQMNKARIVAHLKQLLIQMTEKQEEKSFSLRIYSIISL